jgi:RNA polymerase sigma-70 factor, ECF subfamily
MQTIMTTDSELIRLSIDGDGTAFTELVRRHDRVVFGLIARYVVHAEDAKDVYQEVFLRVHRGLKSFRFGSQFATWLHRITVNVCIDHARRSKRSVLTYADSLNADSDADAEADREPRSNIPGPEQHVMDAETRLRVRDAIASLPPRQRMVFVLRHEEGKALGEIAAELGCGTGTVKRYLFDATRTMRKELHDLLHEKANERKSR